MAPIIAMAQARKKPPIAILLDSASVLSLNHSPISSIKLLNLLHKLGPPYDELEGVYVEVKLDSG